MVQNIRQATTNFIDASYSILKQPNPPLLWERTVRNDDNFVFNVIASRPKQHATMMIKDRFMVFPAILNNVRAR
jgi:hypothetical protein